MSIQGKEVLIIDDTPEVRLLARKICENSGMVVTEATSVESAFKILANNLPNLILLDLKMPQKSGFDFLKARSSVPAIAAIPVIVVSAIAEREAVYKAVALGANDYVAKPLSSAVLVKKVRKALKDIDFMSYKFAPHQAPKATCTVSGIASKANETGFVITSPFKFNAGTIVQIDSEKFRELGFESTAFVADETPSFRDASGCYSCRINVVGLKEPITWTLKKTGS